MMWASGVGTYIRNLVPGILAARPKDQFYLLGRPGEMERGDGFRRSNSRWIPASSRIYTIQEQWEMARLIPPDSDLFWSPFYNFPLFWRGRLLVTVHDVFHLAMSHMAGGIHKRLYSRFMFNRLVQCANAIISVSQFSKNELIRWTRVNAEKIHPIHNGVEEYWFKVKRVKNPHPKPYLLFVGNVKPNKNLYRLLGAFARLKDRIPHDLVIVGQKEGFLTGDKEVLEKARRMEGRIQFTGALDRERLAQYYVSANLLVFPSLYEGFGLPPVEAMACRVPIAVSNAASLPEICGDAAVYFDPLNEVDIADKIWSLVGSYQLRQKMIKKGLHRAKLFSWKKAIEKTNLIIQNLLDIP
jgi:glycosyltransferase involved in cell wall biosynthesis